MGAVFVVSGPTGVGKSTLLSWAMGRVPGLTFSVSATTREPRLGEVDGEHYHFMGHDRFAELVDEGAFLEHATVYDQRYGTLLDPVRRTMAAGDSVVLDIDAQGSALVRESLPEAVHVMILPPDLDTLRARLRGRGMAPDRIAARMAQVSPQIRACATYDYVITNDHLDTARTTLMGIFLAELSRVSRRAREVHRAVEMAHDSPS